MKKFRLLLAIWLSVLYPLSALAQSAGPTISIGAYNPSAGGGTPGGSSNQVQYNNTGAFGGIDNGTSGQVLTSNGAGSAPSFQSVAGTGTVTEVDTGTGLTGGPITGSGTISLANINNNTVLGNVSGGSAAPIALTAAQLTTIPNLATAALKGLLPALTDAQIIVGKTANNVQAVALSGDATITNAGVLTVAKINGATLGTTTATSGNILIGSGSQWVTNAVSGDGTLSSSGALVVTKTNGTSFAASATTDTTNASNISSGTLAGARVPTLAATGGTIDGVTIGGTTPCQAQVYMPINTQSGTSYTLVAGDAGSYLRFTSGSAVTLTVPANATVAFAVGTEIVCMQAAGGKVSPSAAGGVTLNFPGSTTGSNGQYTAFTMKKVATNTWDIFGNLI